MFRENSGQRRGGETPGAGSRKPSRVWPAHRLGHESAVTELEEKRIPSKPAEALNSFRNRGILLQTPSFNTAIYPVTTRSACGREPSALLFNLTAIKSNLHSCRASA